jgi:pantothenate kinase
MKRMTPQEILVRYETALAARQRHEGIWRDCYNHVLPPIGSGASLFDATVPADNQAERAATIRMRERHWGRTVGRA